MKNKNFWIIGASVLAIVVLLAWPRFSGQNKGFYDRLDAASADCLPQGHTNLAQHIHPHLQVVVDGAEQTIPVDVGVIPRCMAEMHTHDTSGTIHIETAQRDKTFMLKDFFAIWGEPFDRPGYTMTVTVDGVENTEGGALILKDQQQVVVTYTKQ